MKLLISLYKKLFNKKEVKIAAYPFVKLNPNDFLTNDVVFYFESVYDVEVNKYLRKNYTRINRKLEKKGMTLIYLPKLLSEKNTLITDSLWNYINYFFPTIKNNRRQNTLSFEESLKNIDLSIYYQALQNVLNIPKYDAPVLIHCIDIEDSSSNIRAYEYSNFPLNSSSNYNIKQQINYYLKLVRIRKNEVFFQLSSSSSENEYNADNFFDSDGQKIKNELQQLIYNLKKANNERTIVLSIIYIIENLKDSQPEICKKINSYLFEAINKPSQSLSKIFIDHQYRIFLPDYNNIEIDLTPLPKTFYLFMLKHPEGIMFKELSDYRQELIDIYVKVGNRLDKDQITKSIHDLTDIRSNSVNEKCSRIKEAFISKMDESIAKNYYITGSRSELKLITLDRSLVDFAERK
jgi:hypothetical protein